jgi:hypothetical protein
MRKQKHTRSHNSTAFIVLGIILLAVTPLVQPMAGDLLTLGCPVVGNTIRCDFEVGIEIAAYSAITAVMWLFIAITMLIVGILKRLDEKKLN